MTTPPNRSGTFRRQLHTEVSAWLAEGLITPGQAEMLEVRYALKDASKPGVNRFTAFLYALGALLIGGGVITFIAFNWKGIPDPLKVAALLSLMVFFQGAGYYLYKGDRPALGHALLLLGAVLFGANIGLFGQMYGADGNWATGCGMWALGCTMLAYAVGSTPIMVLALAASATTFAGSFVGDEVALWSVPVLIVLQGLPFALRHRSSFVYFLTLNLFGASQMAAAAAHSGAELAHLTAVATGTLLFIAGALLQDDPARRRMGRTSQVLGALWLCGPLFLNSIWFIAEGLIRPARDLPLRNMTALLTALLGVMCLICLGPVLRRQERMKAHLPLIAAACAATLLTALALLSRNETVHYYASLVLFFVTAFTLVWTGLVNHDRLFYVLGTFFLGARILAYFIFVDTGLLTKSAVMVVGGVAVIVVAMQFERWAARLAGKGARGNS